MLGCLNDASAWMSHAIGLVALYPEWALFVAFLAAIIEALAVIGTVHPRHIHRHGRRRRGRRRWATHAAVSWRRGRLARCIGDFLSYWVGFRFRFTVRQLVAVRATAAD